MAERTVKVQLVAQVSGYLAGMDQAARKTRLLATEAERLAAKGQVFDQLGRGLVVFGAIAAAAVGIAVKKFADFDQAMSNVKAVTQESTENMALLRDAALDAGGATIYTATEAANAIEELGKAGLSTADILGGALAGALSLAASGQLEVARAAEITATTLKQFNLDGSQSGHVADVLSAGAGKALGSVEDLAQGLKFVGPVAASMGVSLEETTGALALFADQGIIGEQAGTSLRGAISSLVSPSAEASKELDRLNVSLFDADNNFIGVAGTAGALSDAYSEMDEKSRSASLGIIFGNQQLTAARILFESGAGAVEEYTAAVDDAGYAAQVARDRLDNLTGDVEKLGGAFDSALIKSGSAANDVLRTLVQTATFFVDAIGNAPQPVLDVALAVGAVTAATALAGGVALIAVPKVAAFNAVLKTSGISARAAAGSIGIAGGAIALATGYLVFFATTAADAARTTDELKATLDESTGSITKYTKAWIAKSVAENEWIKNSAKDVGVSQEEIVQAILQGGNALDNLKSKFTAQNNVVDFFNGSGVAAGNAEQSIRELRDGVVGAKESFEETPPVVLTAAEAYQKAADNAAALQSNLSELIDTINKANGVGQDAVSSNAAYQDALAGIGVEVKRQQDAYEEVNGTLDGYVFSLDQATAAGSANADMFADLAQKSQDAAKAQFDVDGNTQAYLATLSSGRQTLYDQIVALTGNADAAQALTDKIYAIPTEAEVNVLVETDEAQRRLDLIKSTLGEIDSRGLVLGAGSTRGDGTASANGNMFAYANGGIGEGMYSGGAPLYKFAEPETKWEAFISGRPGQEPRNRMIWAEAGQRLGMANGSGGVGGTSVSVTIPIAPTPGMDEATLATQIDHKLNYSLRGIG